jgi:uncharacterized protein YggU (UPF0235/DUF167 family)
MIGWEEGVLRIRLRARAVEGKANKSLLEYLAGELGLRPHQVGLMRGAHSREKLVEVELASLTEVVTRLDKPS